MRRLAPCSARNNLGNPLKLRHSRGLTGYRWGGIDERRRLTQQNAPEFPIEPKALDTRPTLQPRAESVFYRSSSFCQMRQGFIVLAKLITRHRENHLCRCCPRSVILSIPKATLTPFNRFGVVAPPIFEQSQGK